MTLMVAGSSHKPLASPQTRNISMAVSLTVGGVRGTFQDCDAEEVAGVLDNAFGAEGDWDGSASLPCGELGDPGWSELQRRSIEELGRESIPNLLALGSDGNGVYLPANVQTASFPLKGGLLSCASLPGLRNELAELADRWSLPLDDDGLNELLRVVADPDDGPVAEPPEILGFARLALAANEAVRRDCPLWLVGKSVDRG
jgi:hypothetical protein